MPRIGGLLLVVACVGIAGAASAQQAPITPPASPAAPAKPAPPPEKPKLGPTDGAELGLIIATGNARSTSLGLRNVYIYRWENAELDWEAGWLRAASRNGDRFAVQTGNGFDIVEPETRVDSERLFSKVQYQRQISARTDWFTNFDAVRDEPSNINRQFVF